MSFSLLNTSKNISGNQILPENPVQTLGQNTSSSQGQELHDTVKSA